MTEEEYSKGIFSFIDDMYKSDIGLTLKQYVFKHLDDYCCNDIVIIQTDYSSKNICPLLKDRQTEYSILERDYACINFAGLVGESYLSKWVVDAIDDSDDEETGFTYLWVNISKRKNLFSRIFSKFKGK